MEINYIPANVERLALVAIYQGLVSAGKAEFELVEEPIVGWEIQADKHERTVRPLIAGYQRHELSTIRVAIYNYDGTVTWEGKQFENQDTFLNDFSALVLHLEAQSKD